MKVCWILSNAFSPSIEMITWECMYPPGAVRIDQGVSTPHLGGNRTTGTNQGSVDSGWGVCATTRDCVHQLGSVRTSSWRELRPQAPGRVQIKEGCTCTRIARRRPTIKKEWVEAGNTRIPPGRGNPPTKESPTDNNRRRWRRDWKSH